MAAQLQAALRVPFAQLVVCSEATQAGGQLGWALEDQARLCQVLAAQLRAAHRSWAEAQARARAARFRDSFEGADGRRKACN
eukprot:11183087-Alexandrium_andersonii.AAC.1